MSIQAVAWVLDNSPSKLGRRLVLISIASHADNHGCEAYAAVKSYAEDARLSVRQVHYALRQLKEAGEIALVGEHLWPKTGRTTNVYEIVGMQNPQSAEVQQVQNPTATGAKSGARGVQRTADNTSLEPSLELKPIAHAHLGAQFDEFWNAYPLKLDKARARAKFDKLVRAGAAPEAIAAGAAAYRDDPNRRDEFTKYPATWLNAGAWENGPLPERAEGNGQPAGVWAIDAPE